MPRTSRRAIRFERFNEAAAVTPQTPRPSHQRQVLCPIASTKLRRWRRRHVGVMEVDTVWVDASTKLRRRCRRHPAQWYLAANSDKLQRSCGGDAAGTDD